jgi:hypothetical protein
MSLWTPGGEVPVNRSGQDSPSEPATGDRTARPTTRPTDGPGRSAISEEMLAEAAAAAGVDLETLSEEERRQLEAMLVDMAEAQARLAEAPAAEVVVNHLGGMYELARIHLSQDPPRFDDASIAIDALTGVLDAVEPRLGPNGPALRDAVGQLQMAFVQLRQRYGADEPQD